MIDGKTVLGWMPQGTGSDDHFGSLFDTTHNVMEKGCHGIDALILWGGEDISSSYYKEEPHPQTDNRTGIPSKRDIQEWKAMQWCFQNKVPIIGICRGAQFLCVFSGGSLVQHVNGHHRNHAVVTSTNKQMETSSCHHQMMYLKGVKHNLLAWSLVPQSSVYEGENKKVYQDMFQAREPEVVYFPRTRGLAIQGHPEWMPEESEFVQYCLGLVKTYLLQKEESYVE